MKYKIIEIGTSDFRIDSLNELEPCILIEPVKYYLDNIPNKTNITKINAAISNVNGIVDVYWVNADYVEKYNLPNWLRGCNSIEIKHPTVVNYCEENNIDYNKLVTVNKINTITPNKLFEDYNITEIDYLKIDTEGHDIIILNAILNTKNKPIIHSIKFESNELVNETDYQNIIKKLEPFYNIERFQFDTLCTLK